MEKDKMLLPFSILCLSASILYGAGQISMGIQVASINISNKIESTIEKANQSQNRNEVMDLESAAKYLHIGTIQLQKMTESQDPTIPFINIDNAYLFSKTAIDKWLETHQGIIVY